jgi:class 3 adenylate cyclase
MSVPEIQGTNVSFAPGWDRQDSWTLRFLDRTVERAYLDAGSLPGRQRLRIANAVGAGIWLTIAVLGPPFLGIPAQPLVGVALVNSAWEIGMVLLTRRALTLHEVWGLAVATTLLSAGGVVIGFGVGGAFAVVGAAALMTNGVFGIALVRPAGWVAAALGLIQIVMFGLAVAAFGGGTPALFQGLLLVGTMGAAAISSRYLESAERTAFARAYLVADLHRRIDRLFRQYLSPDVAQALVDDPARAELGGELVDVSVLFADLSDYTSFSERTPPHEVVAMLNASFAGVVPSVFAEGGTIVSFAGDSLMAIFNAPLRQSDHALRACRAALALQRAIQRNGEDGTRPRFRVGINTGPALVGNIGSAELRNFSALGDTTNVAARLQTYAQPGSIVIGEPTYRLVRDVADARALGAADLKGKSAATAVYELIGLRSQTRPV